MTFFYTIYDYTKEGLRLKVNVDKTEFLGNGYEKAVVVPYYRNEKTGSEWQMGRKCKKTVFRHYDGGYSIMWNGSHVRLNRPDVAKKAQIENGKIYDLPDEIILATIVFGQENWNFESVLLVKDCIIPYNGQIMYERIPFEVISVFDGKYKGKIKLKGESDHSNIDFCDEVSPEDLLKSIQTKIYRINSEDYKREMPKKYPRKSFRGWLFG